jgi:hypothetical protein
MAGMWTMFGGDVDCDLGLRVRRRRQRQQNGRHGH